jgi:hypothetical protein
MRPESGGRAANGIRAEGEPSAACVGAFRRTLQTDQAALHLNVRCLSGLSAVVRCRPAGVAAIREFAQSAAAYCLSNTTTLWTACPFSLVPWNVDVRDLPSFARVVVTVIVTLPSFFIVASTVLASTRFTDTVSA